MKQPTPAGDGTIEWCGQPFVWVACIQPKTGEDGTPLKYSYVKAAQKPLNPHGEGPFCCLDVGDDLPDAPGIFVVTLDRRPVYVGIGKSLKRSWGSQGFGKIYIENCYKTGQFTNCKVNHRILQEVESKRDVELWIHVMEEPGTLKRQLIRELDPPWNDQG